MGGTGNQLTLKTDSQWLLKSDSSATERRISHSSTLLWQTLAHLATVVTSSSSALTTLTQTLQPSFSIQSVPLHGSRLVLNLHRILSYEGVLLRNHLDGGVAKGALTQEQADKKFADWKAQRDAKIEAKKQGLTKAAADKAKAAAEAEIKVNEARAEALAKKKAEAEEAARQAAAEAAAAKAAEESAAEAPAEA